MINTNFINDFSEYFNIDDLKDSHLWKYNAAIEINNANELFDLSVNKIQIINNDQVCETIYLDRNVTSKITSDVYLFDGLNNLQFVLLGENNTIQKSDIINVNVNIFPELIDNETLLTNFIGNDDQMISLCTGNADLEYATSSAGKDKDVHINLDIASHYFRLEGINSDLYEISKEDIPPIKSTIIPRPIAITFSKVSKVYDGTCDITEEVKQLELVPIRSYINGYEGYKFSDVNKEYNDFGDSGFVDEIYEENRNSTILFQKDGEILDEIVLNTNNMDPNSIKFLIDGYKFKVMASNINVETWVAIPENHEEPTIKKYAESTCNNIIKGNYPCDVLCYCEINIHTIDGSTKKLYRAIDPRGCYDNRTLIKDPLVYESNSKQDIDSWLTSFGHAINHFQFRREETKVFDSNENDYVYKELDTNNIVLVPIYVNNVDKYKVKDKAIIEYRYSNNDIRINTYVDADYDYVKVNFDNAYFENKNVEDTVKPIRFKNLRLEGDIKGDNSENYQIASYTITGTISKRPITPHIEFIDKIYDGLTNVPFRMDSAYYNGLENSIEGDNIKIDTKCIIADKTENGKINVETGLTKFHFDDCNVGLQNIHLENVALEGDDANNYTLLAPVSSIFKANINKRPIKIKINRIKLYRSDLRWDVDYEFDDVINTDNITISINSNNNLQFKVYARNLSEDNINNNYNTNELLSTYFTYDFNNNYKFENAVDNTELQPIYESEVKHLYYNVKDAMPAEPNTERINVIPELNPEYTGNVVLNPILVKDSFTIRDEFDSNNSFNISNVVTSFYESQDKLNRIYDGCKVKVTNIHLDPSNSKSNNYELLNTETETILEII